MFWFIGFIFFALLAALYFISTVGNALTGHSWIFRLIITIVFILLTTWTYSHL